MGALAAAMCELLPTGWGDEPHAVSPPETPQLGLLVLGTEVVCVGTGDGDTGGQLPDERDENHVSAILAYRG